MKYPVTIKIELHITDGDGSDGSMNYSHAWGTVPSDEDMATLITSLAGKAPDGYRLMTAQESAMHYLREEKGYQGPDLSIHGLMDEGEEFFQVK